MSFTTSLKRRVFVVGGRITPFIGKGNPSFIHPKHPDFGKRTNPTLEQLISTAVNGTFEDLKVSPKMIEKAIIGNFASDLFNNQGHLGALVTAAHPDLRFLPAWHVEGACASGGLAFYSAIDAIQGGNDVTLVVGAEQQSTVSPRQGGDFLARASHYATQRQIDDFTFPALFGRRMKAYCTHYNLNPSDVAHVSVKAYANGNLNPLAHMHKVKMTLEQASVASDKNPNFLGNADFKAWLKVSDCSQVSDGGAGMILCSEEGLKKLGKNKNDCIEVLSATVATDDLTKDGSLIKSECTAYAVQKALGAANIKAADINIAEVHDCFNIAEVLAYESIGWAKPGEGTRLAKDGVTHITGKHPTNTGGGLISFGHPVGATGVKQVLEVFRQMKGQCGAYQVGGSQASSWPTMGLTVNMGGDDKTVVSSILTSKIK